MAQQQNDSLNQMPNSENSFMNDVTNKSFQQNGSNIDTANNKNVSNSIAMAPPPGTNPNTNMNEQQKGKPTGPNGGPVGIPPTHGMEMQQQQMPYAPQFLQPPQQRPYSPQQPEDQQQQQQQPIEHMYQGPPYGRYHDPNMPHMDVPMYRYHPGGKPAAMIPPNRPPPQRYMQPQQQQMPPTSQTTVANQQSQQQPQQHWQSHQQQQQQQWQSQPSQQPPNAPIGQTPTLNSLLQSQAPQQRPYSPQQAYRQPPPNSNTSRIQSQYPMGSYPPPPPQQNQSGQLGAAGAMQYPYPHAQRYPTPPASGSNHRPPYQYASDQSRWPPPTGPSAQHAAAHQPHPHPSSPQQQHLPAQSPVHAPSPSPQPPPAAHSPHQQDSIGQNSNDSSSCNAGGVGANPPGTPNSMAMRPTPSPTGSSGSRSMSPAVGPPNIPSRSTIEHQQSNHRPPYPATHQGPEQAEQQQQPQQQTRSPMIPTTPSPGSGMMAQQGNYPPSPHMHAQAAYKSATGSNTMPNAMPPYGAQSQQFPQGSYPRPQYPANYGPASAAANPAAGQPNVPNQYGGRPMPNQAQFPGAYPQGGWPTNAQPNMNHIQGKNGPAPNAVPPRPLNHLKQHLLHKGGYGNQSPTSPQSFVNGPAPMHQPMGPPQMQGPIGSHQIPRMQAPGSMGPPFSPHHNSQAASMNTHPDGIIPPDISQDNGISSGSSASSQHPVTSIITTGPDGTTIDEASQQSTISNASAASDDPQCSTPKRKSDVYNQSHLASAGSTPTMHDDFEMGSPTNVWPRTPASPVFNSHTNEPAAHRSSKKSDSLCKLYEMDDNPDRRPWLDKLLSFMEERRTPITACPTISKQPLDLYRLYILVKERAGFVEVTKSKTWKDIAGMLGIGASSSAAYTLRKHYTKNLLAFECHYDRGGVDPLPIIQQVEAGSKKKTPKPPSAPSPDANHKGSSNSQDSFPPPGSSSTSMDSYNAYPPAASAANAAPTPSGYPTPPTQNTPRKGNATEEFPSYNDTLQRSPSQTNPQAPHAPGQYPTSQQNYNQYPMEQQPYAQQPFQQPQQGQFPPPPNRYPPYDAPETNIPTPTSAVPGAPASGESYRNYSGAANYPPQNQSLPQRPYNQHQQPPVPPNAAVSSAVAAPPSSAVSANAPGVSAAVGAPPTQYPQPVPPQFEYRQPEQAPQARRHPDFTKESQYPAPGPYGQRPQIYPNWQNNASPSHYNRGQYPQAPQQWANQRLPGPPVMGSPVQGQWNEQHRYPPQNAQPPYQGSQPVPSPQWPNMNQQQMGNVPSIRPPQRAIPGKAMPGMPPPQAANKPQMPPFAGAPQAKRDIVFPADSVEAVTPLLYRRKRLTKSDIGQTDMWRIFMCLQSGLLSECTWALDVMNILLFDDSSIQWFGLNHLPGLLSLLLDHFQKSLTDMFDSGKCVDRAIKAPSKITKHRKSLKSCEESDCTEAADNEEAEDGLLNDSEHFVDLGQVTKLPNPNDRLVVLKSMTNYTMCSRKGLPVKIKDADDDIFVLDLKRSWDYHDDGVHRINTTNTGNWSYGHTEASPYAHIIDPFKGEFVDIPFAKKIKSSDRKRKADATTEEKEDQQLDEEKSANTKAVSSDEALSKCTDAGSDQAKSAVSSPKTSVKDEKIEESNEPKVVETTEADKAIAVDTKPEPMETDSADAKSTTESSNANVAEKAGDSPTKKEQSPDMDSDCREVDMELEKIPNGPQSNEAATASSQSVATSEEEKGATASTENTKIDENAVTNAKSFDVKQTIQDPAETLKRRRVGDCEDECYARDEASLYLISENQDTIARRCISISNILRNLTFVPGNETVFANSETFLSILGKILLLHHRHPVRTQTIRNYDREDDTDFSDSCSSLQGEGEWWWDYLIQLRENMMVAIANIAGHMQLAKYDEFITRPCLDGLLHWAVCPSAHGQDPFPSSNSHSALSPQRLALEALCKICVTDANVDLVIATPPFTRLENLCSVLTRHLCRNEDQVLREFSVNLLHYLAAADSAMARTVAMQSPCISYLVAFIEQAEQTALGVANQHGINYLRDNPDSMGTSLDMLRRTAGTLLHLARHPDNRPLFLQQEQRLLGLVMSHILDQQVALIISRVLFQVSRGAGAIMAAESPAKKLSNNNCINNSISTSNSNKRFSNTKLPAPLATNSESSIPVS